ncbi:hypothetical protein C8R44DRAFT_795042 [Mycena epipterygia]|nr:hypothetical protein C8R44DRAFT_795042 [Mycena epipterygia]
MKFHPLSTHTRVTVRDYMIRLENEYGIPAKRFIIDSFQEYPLTTSLLALCAVTSLTLGIVLVTLAVFAICFAVSSLFVNSIIVALCFALCMSTALLSFLVLAVFAAGLVCLPSNGMWSSTSTSSIDGQSPSSPNLRDIAVELSSGVKNAFRPIFSPLKRGLKARLLRTLVICDLISRIRLPRHVRHNFLYRALLGPTLFAPGGRHILQRALALPFSILRAAVWFMPSLALRLVRLPFILFGWKTPLAVYLILLLLSPCLRVASQRAFSRVVIRVSTVADAGTMAILQSPPVVRVRELPWKAYATVALTIAEESVHGLLAFLRAQLEEGPAVSVPIEAVSPPTEPSPSEDAAYEMVSSVIPTDASGSMGGVSTSLSVSEDTVELRARKVAEAISE